MAADLRSIEDVSHRTSDFFASCDEAFRLIMMKVTQEHPQMQLEFDDPHHIFRIP